MSLCTMWLTRKFTNAMRRLKQLWANPEVKGTLWDQEYSAGRWDHCEHTMDALIYHYVYHHCNNPSILDLGCGSGNTANEMCTSRYCDYTGVDVSKVAIQRALARSTANGRWRKNRYIVADILIYAPPKKYDAIIFRESIYYIPLVKLKSVLTRYSEFLRPQGKFIVQVSGSDGETANGIMGIIEKSFTLLEVNSLNDSGGFIAVFVPLDEA